MPGCSCRRSCRRRTANLARGHGGRRRDELDVAGGSRPLRRPRTKRRGRAICACISKAASSSRRRSTRSSVRSGRVVAPNGLVLRRGCKVASWGDTRQVDFTFSAAKSYLSLLAGIAVTDGLIAELDEPVGGTVRRRRLRRDRITARSPGGICCSRPPNGRARCSASPT